MRAEASELLSVLTPARSEIFAHGDQWLPKALRNLRPSTISTPYSNIDHEGIYLR